MFDFDDIDENTYNTAMIDYDPNKDKRKYIVYRNDIKYKKYRNIDPNRAIWEEDVKHDFNNIDTDSLEYRINECEKEKYVILDLSYTDKNCFIKLKLHSKYKYIENNLQHLFAEHSNIEIIPDLNEMTKLETLDISFNNLSNLPKLPKSLVELVVNNNKISQFKNELPNLKRLKVSNNNIASIIYNDSLESIYLNNNPISYICELPKLYYMNISGTKIDNLYRLPLLKFLNCSKTLIKKIPEMKSLIYLICTNSEVADISELQTLETLEISNSKIIIIHYMEKLKKLIYFDNGKIKLSSKYKIYNFKQNRNDIIEVNFKC